MDTATVTPELDPAAVARWRESGGRLVDLLTEAQRLGGVCAVRFGGERVLVVTEANAVQQVLARHPDRTHRTKVLFGDGMVCATGEQWRKQRRVMQSQFSVKGIRRFEGIMRDSAVQTAGRWAESARSGEPRDLDADMRHFSLDIIWRSMTGKPLDDTTHRQFLATGRVLAGLAALAPATGATQHDFTAELADVDAVAARAMTAARDVEGPNLLHSLFAAAEQHPEYTDQLIRDEVVTLLTAGYETTSSTLGWLFRLLNDHPEERDRVLATEEGSAERAAALRGLLDETMRLYPTAWLIPRHASADDMIAGHRIEAGTRILTSPYVTHRDPVEWPEPERFRPERFTGRRPADGTYFPFGLGQRTCIGAQFTLQEMTILLEHLLPAFTVTARSPRAEPVFGVTLTPSEPMTVTLTATAR